MATRSLWRLLVNLCRTVRDEADRMAGETPLGGSDEMSQPIAARPKGWRPTPSAQFVVLLFVAAALVEGGANEERGGAANLDSTGRLNFGSAGNRKLDNGRRQTSESRQLTRSSQAESQHEETDSTPSSSSAANQLDASGAGASTSVAAAAAGSARPELATLDGNNYSIYSYSTVALFALLVLINLIVILGNILVIVAVNVNVKLRNVTNIFIVSLAIADLLLGLFVLPYALLYEVLDVWIFGRVWCRGWLVTDVWISTASILNLCAISIDRYVAVTRPVKYRSIMTSRRAKYIVAGIWVVSFLICFPPLLPLEWQQQSRTAGSVAEPKSARQMDSTANPDSPNRARRSAVQPNAELLATTGTVLPVQIGHAHFRPVARQDGRPAHQQATAAAATITTEAATAPRTTAPSIFAPSAATSGAARRERPIETKAETGAAIIVIDAAAAGDGLRTTGAGERYISIVCSGGKLGPVSLRVAVALQPLEGDDGDDLQLRHSSRRRRRQFDEKGRGKGRRRRRRRLRWAQRRRKRRRLCARLATADIVSGGGAEAAVDLFESSAGGAPNSSAMNASAAAATELLLTGLLGGRQELVAAAASLRRAAARGDKIDEPRGASAAAVALLAAAAGAQLPPPPRKIIFVARLALCNGRSRAQADARTNARATTVAPETKAAHRDTVAPSLLVRLADIDNLLAGFRCGAFVRAATNDANNDRNRRLGAALKSHSPHERRQTQVSATSLSSPLRRDKREPEVAATPSGAAAAAEEPAAQTKSGCELFYNKTYVVYSAMGSFYIPMLIMVFFYSRIYLVASRAHRAMRRGYMTTKWPPSRIVTKSGGGDANSSPAAGRGANSNAAVRANAAANSAQIDNHKLGKAMVASAARHGRSSGGYDGQAPQQVTLRIHKRTNSVCAASQEKQRSQHAARNAFGGAGATKALCADREQPSKLVKLSAIEQQARLRAAPRRSDTKTICCGSSNSGGGTIAPSNRVHIAAAAAAHNCDRAAVSSARNEPQADAPKGHSNGQSADLEAHSSTQLAAPLVCAPPSEVATSLSAQPTCTNGGKSKVGGSRHAAQSTWRSQQEEEAKAPQFALQTHTSINSPSSIQITVSKHGIDAESRSTGADSSIVSHQTSIFVGAQAKFSAKPASSAKQVRSRSLGAVSQAPAAPEAGQRRGVSTCGTKPPLVSVVDWDSSRCSAEHRLVSSACPEQPAPFQTRRRLDSDDEQRHRRRVRQNGRAQTSGGASSLVATLPGKVRKHSLMLLSSLTVRSSQTLRRLSLVAAAASDSRRGAHGAGRPARDEDATCSGEQTNEGEEDDDADDSKAERARLNRKRRRKLAAAPKKTLDDYLMAVAGIDSSTSTSDGDEDEDGDKRFAAASAEDDEDEDEGASTSTSSSSGPTNLSSMLRAENLLIPQIAIVAAADVEANLAQRRAESFGQLPPPPPQPKPLSRQALVETAPQAAGGQIGVGQFELQERSRLPSQSPPLPQAIDTPNCVARDGGADTKSDATANDDDKEQTNERRLQAGGGGLCRKGAVYDSATSQRSSSVEPSTIHAVRAAPSAIAVATALLSSGQVAPEAPAVAGGGSSPQFSSLAAQRRRTPKKRTRSKWHAKRLRAETKAAKRVAIIVGGFIFCWLPFFTAYLSRAIVCRSPDCVPQFWLSLFSWLGYLNSAINPVIYGLFSDDFRSAFRRIVCQCSFRPTSVVVASKLDGPQQLRRSKTSSRDRTVSALVGGVIKSIM